MKITNVPVCVLINKLTRKWDFYLKAIPVGLRAVEEDVNQFYSALKGAKGRKQKALPFEMIS